MTALARPTHGSTQRPASSPVTWGDGWIALRDPRAFGPGREADEAATRFLSRVFQVEGVTAVSIDRARGTAKISLERKIEGGRAGLLKKLAAALGDRSGGETEVRPKFVRGIVSGSRTEYLRGPILPACTVVLDGPGRLRLRVGALRLEPALAQRVERLLETVPGVRRASAGSWTGRLLVQYDPEVLPRDRLLGLIGEAFYGPDVWARELAEPEPVRSAVALATLGLAAAGQFALPVLLPACAALLVGLNLRTFRTSWDEVRARKFGLPVLYTAIVVTTLATGQFVSSALMTCFFRYWHRRYRRDLATERHRLLDACMPLPGLVRLLTPGGTEVLVEAEQVRSGDRLLVSTGEVIPVDGLIDRGAAAVDERSLRGTDGATRKAKGDVVLAGTFVLSGDLVVSAGCAVGQTRAASVGRTLVATTSPHPGSSAPTRQAETFAERAVGATLATAGLGLLVGDLNSVSAILRPDYATGPGLGVPLAVLRDVAVCARAGIIVREPTVFERLRQVDLVVLDDFLALGRIGLDVSGVQSKAPEAGVLRYAASAFLHLDDARSSALREACRSRSIHLLDLPPTDLENGVTLRHGDRTVRVHDQTAGRDGGNEGPLLVDVDGSTIGLISFRRGDRLDASGVIRRLREAGLERFAMVSERPFRTVSPLAAALGVNQLRAGLDPSGKAAFLRSCRDRGLKTAFVGDCLRNAEAATEALLAVSVSSLVGDVDPSADPGPAAVQFLCDRLDRLELLWDTARSRAENARVDQAIVVGPNLACVAGAFLFGFNGLAAVALSNLGTYGVYSRATGSLRALGRADRLRPETGPHLVPR